MDIENQGSGGDSTITDAFQTQGMANFMKMAQGQVAGANQVSGDMLSMTAGLHSQIQGQIQEMLSATMQDDSYRVFQNQKAGNRIVMRNLQALEGYDIVSFPDGSETTKDFQQALSLSRRFTSDMLNGASVQPNKKDVSVGKESKEVDVVAGVKDLNELVKALMEKQNNET